MKSNRKIKNFLLLPALQIKFGFYIILLTIGLLLTLGTIIVGELGETALLIIKLTDIEQDIKIIIDESIKSLSWLSAGAIIFYMILILAISIIYTHRLIGPTKAFKRHIENLSLGNYHTKTYLRNGDAFSDIAEHLNMLSNYLKNKDKSSE